MHAILQLLTNVISSYNRTSPQGHGIILTTNIMSENNYYLSPSVLATMAYL